MTSAVVNTGTNRDGATKSNVAPVLANAQAQVRDVQLTVADSFESLGMEASEWDRAVERLGGPIYMTWDWLRTWWEFYGNGCMLRLMVFRKDGEIVGLLPLYLQRLGLLPLRLTVARLVGANIPPKVFDPPMDGEFASECLCLALDRLQQDGCGLFSLGPVSDEFAMAQASLDPSGRWPPHWDVRKHNAGVYTWFSLPATYEAYFSSLEKKRKYEVRLLRKEFHVGVEVFGREAEALSDSFEEFVRLHTEQWQAEGLLGHFGAWPNGLEYNRALVRAQARHQRVRLLRIRANDQTVCAQYAFAWSDCWFWQLPARAVGPTWNRFSLGPTGVVVMIEQAISDGKRRIEGGLGHYQYKLRLGAVERPVWIYRFSWCSPGQRVRQWAAQSMRLALRWGYHKLWYRRIQPWLPRCLRGPQAWIWLQYDF